MVIITLRRTEYQLERTFGNFLLNNNPVCLSLEDTVRADAAGRGKVPGRTAIPAGRYKVNLTHSARLIKMYFEIMEVPNFTGVRIHGGNTEKDTDACPLTGTKRIDNSVIGSQTALKELVKAVLLAFIDDSDKQIFIDVIDTQKPLV